MAKERKRLINEDVVQDQPTTIPARVGQSNRTPGRDNMGQEEVIHSLRMWIIANTLLLVSLANSLTLAISRWLVLQAA